ANLKTAAHRTLPFSTKVRVPNMKNGKSVVVSINDPYPCLRGRLIDLPRSAFSSTGNCRDDLINVRIEVLRHTSPDLTSSPAPETRACWQNNNNVRSTA